MSKWIVFTEQRPPSPGGYLAYHWYADYIQISYWDGNEWKHKHQMTHWQPLPDKPEESNSVAIEMGIVTKAKASFILSPRPADKE